MSETIEQSAKRAWIEVATLREQVEKLTKERDDLRSRRCEVCGYLEHEREHTGCLREQLAALAEQNEKLKDALRTVVDDSEECTDFDGWTAMLLSLDAYHIASTCLEETNDQTDLATPVLNRIRAEGMRMAAEILIDPMDRAAAQKICAQADELEKQNG